MRKKTPIPFCGSTFQHYSRFVGAEECVNLYLDPVLEAAGSIRFVLLPTPGLTLAHDFSKNYRVKALIWNNFTASWYAVVYDKLIKLNANYAETELGTVSGGNVNNLCTILNSGAELLILNYGAGYTYNLSTGVFAAITDADFATTSIGEIVDGYFLTVRQYTTYCSLIQSGYMDGMTWNALAFMTFPSTHGMICAIKKVGSDVVVIFENAIEILYNSGAAIFTFDRIPGAVYDTGGGSQSLNMFGNTVLGSVLFFVGVGKPNGGFQIFKMEGRQLSIISNPSIDRMLREVYPAYFEMDSYAMDGHSFVKLRVWKEIGSASNFTLIYDVTTSMWHTRQSGSAEWNIGVLASRGGGILIGGHISDGELHSLSNSIYTDATFTGGRITRTRTTPVIRKDASDITIDYIQLLIETGVGLVAGDAEDTAPQWALSWSRDWGNTWSTPVNVPMGANGVYDVRTIVEELGQGINWMFKITTTAKVKTVVFGAIAQVEEDA